MTPYTVRLELIVARAWLRLALRRQADPAAAKALIRAADALDAAILALDATDPQPAGESCTPATTAH